MCCSNRSRSVLSRWRSKKKQQPGQHRRYREKRHQDDACRRRQIVREHIFVVVPHRGRRYPDAGDDDECQHHQLGRLPRELSRIPGSHIFRASPDLQRDAQDENVGRHSDAPQQRCRPTGVHPDHQADGNDPDHTDDRGGIREPAQIPVALRRGLPRNDSPSEQLPPWPDALVLVDHLLREWRDHERLPVGVLDHQTIRRAIAQSAFRVQPHRVGLRLPSRRLSEIRYSVRVQHRVGHVALAPLGADTAQSSPTTG